MVYETQKDYFVIFQQIGEYSFKALCAVEDEDVAIDFCKRYGCIYERHSVVKEVNEVNQLVKNIFG